MPRGKKYGPEEIIPKLREAEVLMSQGTTQELAAKQIGVSPQTLIRWRKEYGGLRMDQAKRLKELEKENTRLKRLLADAELDKAILKETASGNFSARRSDVNQSIMSGMLSVVTACRSVRLARCWINLAVRSVGCVMFPTTSHV